MKEDLAIIPIVVGIVEAVKQAGMPSKFAPVLSLLLAIVITVAWTGLSLASMVTGIVYGLSACGLWSGGKVAVTETKKLVSSSTPPPPAP